VTASDGEGQQDDAQHGHGSGDDRDQDRVLAGAGPHDAGVGIFGMVVMDRTTGKVEVTSHNHGFAVDAPLDTVVDTEFGRVEVSHVCLNDGVVEGLRCHDVPAFSVQYHPEAAAGPHDAAYLFDRFTELLAGAAGRVA
jgi:carbamoyl-phosphate synthase small subunit